MAVDPRVLQALAWIDRYSTTLADHQQRVAESLIAVYASVEDLEDPTLTIPAAVQAVAIMQTGRLVTAGYAGQLASILREIMTGVLVPPSPTLVEYPRNAEPFDVYSRPIFLYRALIAKGYPPDRAFLLARDRAMLISDYDQMLTDRNTALRELIREVQGEQVITGYRRIIRPELSKTGTCGLCIVAADRIYKTSELMPMHERCNCIVMPITSRNDLPDLINRYSIDQAYADASGNTAALLKKIRYVVDDHGELGPVLRRAPGSPPPIIPIAA